MSIAVPILFIIWNRPEYTRESFAAIRQAKPKKLYIAADGPRQGKDGEKELCYEARNLVLNSIDWECDVKTRFQEKNLGCYLGVSSSVSWFFENEEMGVILEDDVIANLSFFTFCQNLLEKYKDEKKVWTIGGYRYINSASPQIQMDTHESFSFIQNFWCWGWATWADRWNPYSLDIVDYDWANLRNINSELNRQYHMEGLAILQANLLDTWDLRYELRGIEHNAMHIMPHKSLCKNIGIYGIHFNGHHSYYCNLPVFELGKIIYPKNVELNKEIQESIDENYKPNFPKIPKILQDKNVFLWGTGKYATLPLGQLKYNNEKIIAYVDSNKEKQQKRFNGYDVISPQELFEKKLGSFFVIITSIMYADEIAQELERNGLIKGKDFWSPTPDNSEQ